MAASIYDIVITKDTDFEVTLTFNDDTGAPMDIEDYEFQGEIRPTPGDATSNPAEFDITIMNEEEGEIKLSLTDVVTGNLTGEKYYYDIVGDDDDGHGTRTILISGRVTVLPAVSKDWS
jgi:hypothetical protein